MLTIVKSILGSTDDNKFTIVQNIMDEIQTLLNPQELKVFKYLYDSFITYSQFPTEEIYLTQFPEYKLSLQETQPLETQESLDFYRREFIVRHQRANLTKQILTMAGQIQSSGLTQDMVETLRDSVTEIGVENTSLESSDVIELYEKSKQRGDVGVKTYIPEIDQLIGSIEPGTITVIAGYTAHGKTTLALNMAYKAAKSGTNVAYISLEVPERDVLYNLISLHSTDPKFGIEPIPSKLLRRRALDEKQEENFKKVAVDFNNTILPNFHLLTEKHFKDFSYGEVRDILYRLDNQKPLEGLFLDHANLLKYFVKTKYSSTGDAINEYVSFFRKMAISFRKEADGKDRQLAVFLLAQTNRAGYLKAATSGKKDPTQEGRYDSTGLSESHELERSASFIITVFTSEAMRLSQESRVQLIKNRSGQSHEDPISVNFKPDFYQFGEMDTTSSSISNDYSGTSFESILDIDPSDLGFNLGSLDLSDL